MPTADLQDARARTRPPRANRINVTSARVRSVGLFAQRVGTAQRTTALTISSPLMNNNPPTLGTAIAAHRRAQALHNAPYTQSVAL